MNRKCLLTLFSLILLTLLSGCFQNTHVRGSVVLPLETHSHTTTVITRYTPPPHAPAHGHRHHYRNHDLQFDSGLNAYIIIGSPGIYFYNDHYLRFYGGAWQFSQYFDRSWRTAQQRHVPHKLREQHARRHLAKEHREERHDSPQHGHQRHHHGHKLTFDSGIGAYRVIKRPGIYFYNNRYIRRHGAAWQTAKKVNGQWQDAKEQHVPEKLRQKRRHKKEKRKHGKDIKHRMR